MTASDAFRQFVLKVHSRCNLACTYCYLYQGPDETWRDRPVRVERATMRRTAARIAAHIGTHRLGTARIDLHGGEPLLGGPDTVLRYAEEIRAAVDDCRLRFFVQSNGTLLTADAVEALAAAGIRVGISLDGGSAALNHRRVDHAGRPSWPAVHRAAQLLAEDGRAADVYAGILCTIDLAQDPLTTYDSLLALAPPALDLLLPHANWESAPPGLPAPGPPGRSARATPYAEWLIPVFDRWWQQGAGGRLPTRIRLFEEIIALLLGAPSAVESLGHSPAAAVLVETDGTIERVDSLRTAYEGASATGLDVFRNSFDEARGAVGSRVEPAPSCRACPVFRVCGGGNPTHRYAAGTAFRNASVYCADLEALIRHIAAVLQRGEQGGTPAVPRAFLPDEKPHCGSQCPDRALTFPTSLAIRETRPSP